MLNTAAVRTPTPTQSHLSSPPPTVKTPRPQQLLDQANGLFTSDQVADASMDELKSMLNETAAAYRGARANAAHHSLQYNLLAMEFSESMKRMQVELDMSHKEVEVLQSQAHRDNPVTPNSSNPQQNLLSPADHQLTMFRDQCRLLEIEKEDLIHRQEYLKSLMLDREAQSREEIERLKERIRENRRHANLLRSGNSVEAISSSNTATPYATPAQRLQPNERERRQFATPRSRGTDEPFAALLLADQVLSQEAATTPSTPVPHARRPQAPSTGTTHHRGSQSLSSIPTTPLQARSAPTAAHVPQTPTPYYSAQKPRSTAIPHTAPPTARATYQQRRRESRDSTISASDLEDDAPAADRPSVGPGSSPHDDEPVTESQASQEARSMLRKSASRSFHASPSGGFSHQQQWARDRGSPTPKSSASGQKGAGPLKQSTIYGKVTKPGLGIAGVGTGGTKRKADERDVSLGSAFDAGKAAKRGRVGGEGVGLGIGGWARSPGQ